VLDGVLRCWGDNAAGQLGDGTTIGPRTAPFVVPGLAPVAEVNPGTCVRLTDGTVKCWGSNVYGEVGTGVTSREPVLVPSTVLGLKNAVVLAQGISNHRCVQLANGTVVCWGDDSSGNFDEPGKVGRPQPVPVVVHAVEGAKSVSIGLLFTCALFGDGSEQCTGYNLDGELGDGTVTPPRGEFRPVVGLSNAIAITCGKDHACAILGDRTVQCWGANDKGQLGTGSRSIAEPAPVAVKGLTNVQALSAGGLHTCALLIDGTVRCWGFNGSGQLGDGTTTDSAVAASVPGLTNVIQVSAGLFHTCALTADAHLYCWGENHYGQLGDGTTMGRHSPVQVTW
jgi:alpha-tubulin suppressor-like RCC1 family protein